MVGCPDFGVYLKIVMRSSFALELRLRMDFESHGERLFEMVVSACCIERWLLWLGRKDSELELGFEVVGRDAGG